MNLWGVSGAEYWKALNGLEPVFGSFIIYVKTREIDEHTPNTRKKRKKVKNVFCIANEKVVPTEFRFFFP